MTAPCEDTLRLACETLTERDIALARAYTEIGVPSWRVQPAGYATLARIIAFQQISTKAAAAIWGRVCDQLPALTAEAVLAADEDALRASGLSRPKIRHMRSIAEAIVAGALPIHTLADLPLDEARAALTAVKGIGPWTADVYLMCAAGQLDVFPRADVGLMESYRILRADDDRLDAKRFQQASDAWAPYRAVAAHLLWGWINRHRGHDSAPAN